jgi:hypothetical protein
LLLRRPRLEAAGFAGSAVSVASSGSAVGAEGGALAIGVGTGSALAGGIGAGTITTAGGGSGPHAATTMPPTPAHRFMNASVQ